MTNPSPQPTPQRALPIDPAALRIVLFGMPDAGKSSLLGALGQASHTQERQLQGRVADPWGGLADLQRRVYDEKPRETLEEIVPYPVAYEPLRGKTPDPDRRIEAVLFDCDGRTANEILTQQRVLDDPKAGRLAAALLEADALVLVVDASATHEQIEADFAEFARFLGILERKRGRSSDIGGLPAFLVLSKCDRLAQPGDKPADWFGRVEQRRQQVETRFKDYLESEDGAPAGFGTIDLKVVPTAVGRPALQGAPAAPREPYGVAELFRQTFRSASDFRKRTRRSGVRLFVTATAALTFVGVLIAGAVALTLTRNAIQTVPLAGNVEGYRSRENPNPSARLTEPLQRKIGELSDMRRNPDFDRLPDDLKEYVSKRLAELTAYQAHKSQLDGVHLPSRIQTLDELGRLESRLQESLAPPAEYANEWPKTDAELYRQKLLSDIKAIRNAVGELTEWHGRNSQAAEDLMQFKDRPGAVLPWSELLDRVASLLASASKPLHPDLEPLKGSEPLPSMKAPAMTYALVLASQPVQEAQKDWDAARTKLERLRDVSLALGLAGDGSAEKSPLKLPEKLSIDQAKNRLQLLRKNYPQAGDWSLKDVSDIAAPDVRSAASLSLRHLTETGQQVVLSQLKQASPDGQETQERWKAIAASLPAVPELQEWAQLATQLQRLTGDASGDPIATLAAFVRQSEFPLKFNAIRVTIPDDMHDSRIRPNGKLVIFQESGATRHEIAFQLGDEEQRDNRRRSTTFAFKQEGDQTFTYRPGDAFYAVLPVRDGKNKEWKLTWSQCRSDLYRFECLVLGPRFHERDEQARNGKLVEVRMAFTPESGIPRVPALIPVVILKP